MPICFPLERPSERHLSKLQLPPPLPHEADNQDVSVYGEAPPVSAARWPSLSVGTAATDFLVWLPGLARLPPASLGGSLHDVSARVGVTSTRP